MTNCVNMSYFFLFQVIKCTFQYKRHIREQLEPRMEILRSANLDVVSGIYISIVKHQESRDKAHDRYVN